MALPAYKIINYIDSLPHKCLISGTITKATLKETTPCYYKTQVTLQESGYQFYIDSGDNTKDVCFWRPAWDWEQNNLIWFHSTFLINLDEKAAISSPKKLWGNLSNVPKCSIPLYKSYPIPFYGSITILLIFLCIGVRFFYKKRKQKSNIAQ